MNAVGRFMTNQSLAAKLSRGGIIAALYVGLVWALQPVSFGIFQFRAAEALAVLPILFPEAVPALFIGVMIANIAGGLGPWDIFGGSVVTLLAAYLTYVARNTWLAYASPIVLNAFLISIYLSAIFNVPYWLSVLGIGISETLVVLGLGVPLIKLLKARLR